MGIEVKRGNWSRFCKKFNQLNQYRPAIFSVQQKGRNEAEISRDLPFMGMAVAKKGRFIDGIEFYSVQCDPNRLIEPLVAVREPVRITVEKESNGMDNRLSVESGDGSKASVVLSGAKDPGQYYSAVEKLAYAIGERRGFAPGGDQDDWFEAERRVKEIQRQFAG